jgi:hypothetical protein
MAYSARLQLPNVRPQATIATSLAKGEKVFFMGNKDKRMRKYSFYGQKYMQVVSRGFLLPTKLFISF